MATRWALQRRYITDHIDPFALGDCKRRAGLFTGRRAEKALHLTSLTILPDQLVEQRHHVGEVHYPVAIVVEQVTKVLNDWGLYLMEQEDDVSKV